MQVLKITKKIAKQGFSKLKALNASTALPIVLTITFLLLPSLLVSSCTPADRGIGKLSGTQGLRFEFLSLPKKLYYDSSIPLVVRVSNLGGFDVTKLLLWLDFNLQYFEFDEAGNVLGVVQNIDLRGRTHYYKGSKTVLGLGTLTPIKDAFSEKFKTINTELTLTACYPYKTVLEQEVCVGNPATDCEDQHFTFTSQAAPVAITSLEARPSIHFFRGNPNAPYYSLDLVITVKNVGEGFPTAFQDLINPKDIIGPLPAEGFTDQDFFQACTDQSQSVYLEAYLSTQKLLCEPSVVKLFDGEGVVKCYLPHAMSISQAYQAPLVVVLAYTYTQRVSKQLTLYNPAT